MLLVDMAIVNAALPSIARLKGRDCIIVRNRQSYVRSI
jgi:hypothetical protein